MTLRNLSRYVAAALVLAVGLAGGSAATPATAKPAPAPAPAPAGLIPHCLVEDGGPQQVCIWDSAVDGNRLPAAPNNVVILYVSRRGEDPEALRLK